MFDAHAESQRRVGQFVEVLERMAGRRREGPPGNCFVIFKDLPPDDDARGHVARARAVVPAAVGLADAVTGSALDPRRAPPDEVWSPDDAACRFVQFMFLEKWFFLDLPVQTLHRAEADRLLRRCSGCAYMRENPLFHPSAATVRECDPVNKVYLYQDERAAAEDMAFIWFELWKYPFDTIFYLTACRCDGTHRWERGTPLR